ncbi:unnamed protein product [Heterobilharzia americana]|nr:unnamed protein product [Heterobilharzia americana]
MKRLGKNKKRRWQHCYKDLQSELQNAILHKSIINQGFTEVSDAVQKKCHIVKGDKDSAKQFREISTAQDKRPYVARPAVQKTRSLEKDVWQDCSNECPFLIKSHDLKEVEANVINTSLPCAGQSYNPTRSDHLSLISRIKTIESVKRKRELKTERFVESLKGAKVTQNPVVDMRRFLHSLNTEVPMGSGHETSEVLLLKKKPKKVNVEKRMKNDLENLPKLLKEIKREDKSRKVRKITKKPSRRFAAN